MVNPQRRALMMGAAGTAAGLGLAHVPGPAMAATVTNGWTYVAPGGSIQAAVDSGAKAIQLGAGTYSLSQPVVMDSGVTLQGVGQSTRLLAAAGFPTAQALIEIGAGGQIDGVCVSSLVLDCDGIAASGIRTNIVGTTGNYQSEPDGVCRFDNLWVYDAAQDGMVYMGTDTQGVTTTRVRVRRARRHGFNVIAPDNWFSECEATTTSNEGAGFYIGGSNCFYTACKAWYCRGHGFHLKGTRVKLVGCEAQDIGRHGFFIEWGKNVVNACVADSCSSVRVGSTAGTYDGFYITPNVDLSVVGCQSFDKRQGGEPSYQRYGFNVPRKLQEQGLLVAPTGWDNLQGLINLR